MIRDIVGVIKKADFDHKLYTLGKTVIIRQNINNQAITTERRAIKEGSTFRFYQGLDLKHGDIIEIKENRSRWRVIYFNDHMEGNIPISFNVETERFQKPPELIDSVNDEEETHKPGILPEKKDEQLAHTIQTEPTVTSPTPPPPVNEEEWYKELARFVARKPILALLLLLAGLGFLIAWNFVSLEGPIEPGSRSEKTVPPQNKVTVNIRLGWEGENNGMEGGYVKLVSPKYGGPRKFGPSNEDGWLKPIKLPQDDGIEFEVSHPDYLKTNKKRWLNLKSYLEEDQETTWFFKKETTHPPTSSSTSASTETVNVNMLFTWRNGEPMEKALIEVIAGAPDQNDLTQRGKVTFNLPRKDNIKLRITKENLFDNPREVELNLAKETKPEIDKLFRDFVKKSK